MFIDARLFREKAEVAAAALLPDIQPEQLGQLTSGALRGWTADVVGPTSAKSKMQPFFSDRDQADFPRLFARPILARVAQNRATASNKSWFDHDLKNPRTLVRGSAEDVVS